jgi:hypothetical protein
MVLNYQLKLLTLTIVWLAQIGNTQCGIKNTHFTNAYIYSWIQNIQTYCILQPTSQLPYTITNNDNIVHHLIFYPRSQS